MAEARRGGLFIVSPEGNKTLESCSRPELYQLIEELTSRCEELSTPENFHRVGQAKARLTVDEWQVEGDRLVQEARAKLPIQLTWNRNLNWFIVFWLCLYATDGWTFYLAMSIIVILNFLVRVAEKWAKGVK